MSTPTSNTSETPAEWIPLDDDRDPDYKIRYYRCPICGGAYFWQTKFCPECGHEMCPADE